MTQHQTPEQEAEDAWGTRRQGEPSEYHHQRRSSRKECFVAGFLAARSSGPTEAEEEREADAWQIVGEEIGRAKRAEAHNGIPDSYWRDVPCGHPADPVAMWSDDGRAVCHCGWKLDPEDGVEIGGAPGPVVNCSRCGCHVAVQSRAEAVRLPADDEIERTAAQAGLDTSTPEFKKRGAPAPPADEGEALRLLAEATQDAVERLQRMSIGEEPNSSLAGVTLGLRHPLRLAHAALAASPVQPEDEITEDFKVACEIDRAWNDGYAAGKRESRPEAKALREAAHGLVVALGYEDAKPQTQEAAERLHRALEATRAALASLPSDREKP